MAKHCKSRTAAGKACQSAAGANGYCFTHDPERQEARAAARQLGGFHRRTTVRVSGDVPITIQSIRDVLELINAVVADTWQQENSAARSRALLACAEVGAKVLEQADLEARIAKLEATNGRH